MPSRKREPDKEKPETSGPMQNYDPKDDHFPYKAVEAREAMQRSMGRRTSLSREEAEALIAYQRDPTPENWDAVEVTRARANSEVTGREFSDESVIDATALYVEAQQEYRNSPADPRVRAVYQDAATRLVAARRTWRETARGGAFGIVTTAQED